MNTHLTIFVIACVGSFLFELSHITQDIWAFFKLPIKKLWYIPYKLVTCGKCATFHIGWIYFYATQHDLITSIALACVSAIISMFLIKYSYNSNSIN